MARYREVGERARERQEEVWAWRVCRVWREG